MSIAQDEDEHPPAGSREGLGLAGVVAQPAEGGRHPDHPVVVAGEVTSLSRVHGSPWGIYPARITSTRLDTRTSLTTGTRTSHHAHRGW